MKTNKLLILSILCLFISGCKNNVKAETVSFEHTSVLLKDTSVVVSENNEILYEQVDCEEYRKMLLESHDQKKKFSLIFATCVENFEIGYVLYDGKTEIIPIQFDYEEIAEDYSEEGRPNVRQQFYNEIYRGEINGQYVITIQGARIYNAYYIRKKDNKRIGLIVVDDNL